jgi:hypothetical protein
MPMVVKEQEPAALAGRSRGLDCDRRPDQPEQLAAPDPGCVRSRSALPTGKNLLLLLIAILAVLVAVGVLSG